MTLDIARYLRLTQDWRRQGHPLWERPLKQQDWLLNDYLNLSALINTLMVETQGINPNFASLKVKAQPDKVLAIYAQALVAFLDISVAQQWTHLMVLEQADFTALGRFPKGQLGHHYMGMLTMLNNAYYQKRQADFAHAWRSFLKLGLNELSLSEKELDSVLLQILQSA